MNPAVDTVREDKEDLDQLFNEIKKMEFSREAEIFKALGHPIRLKIVYGLLKVGGCNVKKHAGMLGLTPGDCVPAPYPSQEPRHHHFHQAGP